MRIIPTAILTIGAVMLSPVGRAQNTVPPGMATTVPISCEAWLEISDENKKITAEIKTWIISSVRRQAYDYATTEKGDVPYCGTLDCLKDSEILESFNKTCSAEPAGTLGDVVFITGSAEYLSRQH